jgi:hypothetical protein
VKSETNKTESDFLKPNFADKPDIFTSISIKIKVLKKKEKKSLRHNVLELSHS